MADIYYNVVQFCDSLHERYFLRYHDTKISNILCRAGELPHFRDAILIHGCYSGAFQQLFRAATFWLELCWLQFQSQRILHPPGYRILGVTCCRLLGPFPKSTTVILGYFCWCAVNFYLVHYTLFKCSINQNIKVKVLLSLFQRILTLFEKKI